MEDDEEPPIHVIQGNAPIAAHVCPKLLQYSSPPHVHSVPKHWPPTTLDAEEEREEAEDVDEREERDDVVVLLRDVEAEEIREEEREDVLIEDVDEREEEDPLEGMLIELVLEVEDRDDDDVEENDEK